MHLLKYDDVQPGVDIIGDTHGLLNEYCALLEKLGYVKKKGVYRHFSNERTVQNLGDKLDRGNKIPELDKMQLKMIEAGTAKDLIGNHEYNLRCMEIPHPEKHDGLRSRSKFNMEETKQTRQQFKKSKEGMRGYNDMLNRVYSTPIYAENDEFRIAHACIDPKNIAVLKKKLKNFCLTPDDMIHAELNWRQTPLSTAVIETLKGKEIKTKTLLNYGFTQAEVDSLHKKDKRVKWWSQNRETIVRAGDVILDLPTHLRRKMIPLEAVEEFLVEDDDPRPAFFGHYCLDEEAPHILTPKYQCLDFGVIRPHGYLTAYQWNFGDKGLSQDRLVFVPRKTPVPQ